VSAGAQGAGRKLSDRGHPRGRLRAPSGTARPRGTESAILAKGADPIETRRGLPGDPDDSHSRYIEATVGGVLVGCLYLPNGNPQPGPKFDYKIAWFERLIKYAKTLQASACPAILAGDFNVVPTDFDIYNPKSWRTDALLQPDVREAYGRLLGQGWTDTLRARHPEEPIYTFWDYFVTIGSAIRGCASIICY